MPGTGKTHIATGLGIRACMEGYSVFFTSVPRLLTLIREAKNEKSLRSLEIRFERYDLVICDELGYVGFDKESAEMLFNHLSLRTGEKSTTTLHKMGRGPRGQGSLLRPRGQALPQVVHGQHDQDFLPYQCNEKIFRTKMIYNTLFVFLQSPKWYTFEWHFGVF